MENLDFFIDLTQVKTQTPSAETKKTYEPLPKGEYAVHMSGWEFKKTNDGTGEYIKATFTVNSGEHAGRKLFHNFNTKNKSEKAQSIGQESLKSFILAANGRAEHANPQTLDSACGTEVMAWVSQREEIYNGETQVRNTISNFRAADVIPF